MDWSNVNDAPDFSDCMNNQTVDAKVVSVYDGDTIKVIFPLHGVLYKWNCRLSGVDTPELRTRNENEKAYGYVVRDKLREKILNKVVRVSCGDLDKYGRLLVTVFMEDENVNQWLITSDYAFAYDGGTKRSWEEYLLEKQK
jgi:micrococcal nuclease|tara:strand:+ start:55 stop:477 length:423 start_codon:yes stop_codon:yes gene_type:complete